MRTLMLEVISEDYVKTASQGPLLCPDRLEPPDPQRHHPHDPLPGHGDRDHPDGILCGGADFCHPGYRRVFCPIDPEPGLHHRPGLTVFFGVFVVSANFVIDLIYGLVDPRIRVANEVHSMNKPASSLTEQDFVRLPADRSMADA